MTRLKEKRTAFSAAYESLHGQGMRLLHQLERSYNSENQLRSKMSKPIKTAKPMNREQRNHILQQMDNKLHEFWRRIPQDNKFGLDESLKLGKVLADIASGKLVPSPFNDGDSAISWKQIRNAYVPASKLQEAKRLCARIEDLRAKHEAAKTYRQKMESEMIMRGVDSAAEILEGFEKILGKS